MKNTLIDLNNHLFAAMERLNDEDLSNEQLSNEIERSKAIANVAGKIIDNASLSLQAIKFNEEHRKAKMPVMLEARNE